MIISIMLSFAVGLLMAVVFEGIYEIVAAHRCVPLPKVEIATIYWSLLALVGFASGGVIFTLHIFMILPTAVTHIRLSKRIPSRISCRQLLQQVGVLGGQGISNLKTWCIKRFSTP